MDCWGKEELMAVGDGQRAKDNAAGRKALVEKAMRDPTLIALTNDVVSFVLDNIAPKKQFTTAEIKAMLRLVHGALDLQGKVVRAPGGRGRGKKYALPTGPGVEIGTRVKVTVDGREHDGVFVAWAKGNRRARGFAKVVLDPDDGGDQLVTARFVLAEE
jgi:hypothetical protein